MAHNHDHHHDHSPKLTNVNRAFIIGIVLNSLFVVIEVIVGFYSNSLALISDAGHNLGDVAGLLLALLAFRMSKSKANNQYTYGYGKSTILAALLNAIILLITIGGIGIEAIQRLLHPEPIQGKTVAIVAAIGIFINGITALQFFKDKEKDINIKGAYLHLATDALISFGVVIAGIVMSFTSWFWLDSVISLVIMIVVLISTWQLLKDSFRLSMDGVPEGISIEKIIEIFIKTEGINGVHHLHIWAISTTENALTAHLVIQEYEATSINKIKKHLRHELIHQNIQHVTFEFEHHQEDCTDQEHSNKF